MKAALLWVKENIASFGGDPERITLAGLSSGAYAITLLQVDLTAPLFQGGIVMSTPAALIPRDQNSQLLVGDALAASVNCNA